MRRAQARAENIEEGGASRGQVGGHFKGNQRSEQGRQKARWEDETECREGRNKLTRDLYISRSLDEGKCGVIRSRPISLQRPLQDRDG